MSLHRPSRLVAALSGLLLTVSALTLTASPPAAASPTSAEFKTVDQNPATIVFDSPSEHYALLQEMDDNPEWTVVTAKAYVCTQAYPGCTHLVDFYEDTHLLSYTGQASQNAQRRVLRFEGDMPNYLRHLSYYLQVTYDTDPGPGVSYATYYNYSVSSYNGVLYYGFNDVYAYGDTRVTISGPASIPTGSALHLSGTLSCYGRVGYKAPDYGWVNVQYRETPSDDWTYMGGATTYDPVTGAWTYLNLAVGASGQWRAQGSGDNCIEGTSAPLSVEAGSGSTPQPPPSTLPSAPGLTLARVTSTTALLSWTAPTQNATGITGYRLGWTSASGLPVPTWENVYASPENPFLMTNLNPDSDYTMFIEAVTAKGAGARTTIAVHTAAASSGHPPGAHVTAPAAPRRLHARPGNHRALLRWAAPSFNGGARINAYQVHRFNGPDYTVRASRLSLVIRRLKNNATYTFYVRAHNRAGWGPWSDTASVRPHR